jgi:hypothetical protein
MKRVVTGVLLLVGMSVVPALAWDSPHRIHRDIRHQESKIERDRYKLQRDLDRGHYRAARHERHKLDQECRDIHRDGNELGW